MLLSSSAYEFDYSSVLFHINLNKMASIKRLILITFIFSACAKDSNLNYNITYDGDKIVLNGSIDPTEGCIIAVSKSAPPSGTYGLNRFDVDSVKVSLIEDGTTIILLQSMGSGVFKSENFKPKIGHSYTIKASVSALASVESETVIIPDTVQISSLKIENADSLKGCSFRFTLVDKSLNQRSYYRINVSVPDGKSIFQEFKDVSLDIKDCDFDNSNNTAYFSNKCFSNKNIELNYAVSWGNDKKTYKEVTLEIASTSKEYLNYINSLQQPVGLFNGILEPLSIYSNIKNGYGIFYAKNAKKYKFNIL